MIRPAPQILLTAALLSLGCTDDGSAPAPGGVGGGQTGEITRLGQCDEAVAASRHDLSDLAEARLVEVTSPWTGTLEWDLADEAPATVVSTVVEVRDGQIELLGQSDCTRWRVPVEVLLSTEDGRLDETLAGHVDLYANVDEPAVLRGETAVDELSGTLALDWLGPMPAGSVYASFDRDGTRSVGTLFVSPETEGETDEVRLASWR